MRRIRPVVAGPAAGLLALAVLIAFGGGPSSVTPAVAAPQLKPEPPGFEPITAVGRWDGDAENQPWLRADDGMVWRLCFRDRGCQDVALGPLDSTRHIRVTGVAATSGRSHYLFVTALVAVE